MPGPVICADNEPVQHWGKRGDDGERLLAYLEFFDFPSEGGFGRPAYGKYCSGRFLPLNKTSGSTPGVSLLGSVSEGKSSSVSGHDQKSAGCSRTDLEVISYVH
jgi:hypothetical protein